MQLSPTAKAKLIQQFPELRQWFDTQELNDNMKAVASRPTLPPELIAKIKAVKGEKGDKGDKGDKYELTKEDVNLIASKATPKKGVDYYEGRDGKDGKNGIDGQDGKQGKQGKQGEKGDRGEKGKDGKDGSPDTALGIVNKINTLNGMIEPRTIRNFPDIEQFKKSFSKDLNDVKGKLDMRWHGGGLSKVITDSSLTGQGTGASPLSVSPVRIQTVIAMSAQALDGTKGNVFTRTLAGSEVFTQSGFTAGQCFMVEVTQGSGTSYTVTWFGTINWVTSGATAPVQTTTTNGVTTYGFRCTGTNTFLGYLVGTQ